MAYKHSRSSTSTRLLNNLHHIKSSLSISRCSSKHDAIEILPPEKIQSLYRSGRDYVPTKREKTQEAPSSSEDLQSSAWDLARHKSYPRAPKSFGTPRTPFPADFVPEIRTNTASPSPSSRSNSSASSEGSDYHSAASSLRASHSDLNLSAVDEPQQQRSANASETHLSPVSPPSLSSHRRSRSTFSLGSPALSELSDFPSPRKNAFAAAERASVCAHELESNWSQEDLHVYSSSCPTPTTNAMAAITSSPRPRRRSDRDSTVPSFHEYLNMEELERLWHSQDVTKGGDITIPQPRRVIEVGPSTPPPTRELPAIPVFRS